MPRRTVHSCSVALTLLSGILTLSGCGDLPGQDFPHSYPYREIVFDQTGLARFDAKAGDVLVVYRTGPVATWPRDGTMPPYEPITVSAGPLNSSMSSARTIPDFPVEEPTEAFAAGSAMSPMSSRPRLYMPELGDTHQFVYGETPVEYTMRLVGIGAHCYVWVPHDVADSIEESWIETGISEFDRIFGITVGMFGAPRDRDYDPRLHLVLLSMLPTGMVSADIDSMNGLDIITLNMDAILESLLDPAKHPEIGSLMAHELHHNIWLGGKGKQGLYTMNEGMSELAEYRASPATYTSAQYPNFLRYPQGFSLILSDGQFMYGGGLSLSVYIHDRFGPEATKQIGGTSPLAMADNLDQATGIAAERLLADWATALLLSGRTSDARYRIFTIPIADALPSAQVLPPLGMVPMDGSATGQCRPWGFCYLRATSTGSFTVAVDPEKSFNAVLVPGGAAGH